MLHVAVVAFVPIAKVLVIVGMVAVATCDSSFLSKASVDAADVIKSLHTFH